MGEETYTLPGDVKETLPDGRQIQIGVKGARIAMSEAIRLGLVKPAKSAGPTEHKQDAPTSKAKGKK